MSCPCGPNTIATVAGSGAGVDGDYACTLISETPCEWYHSGAGGDGVDVAVSADGSGGYFAQLWMTGFPPPADFIEWVWAPCAGWTMTANYFNGNTPTFTFVPAP